MPRGVRSNPARSEMKAKVVAQMALWRKVGQRRLLSPRNKPDVTTPAMAIDDMAPFPNGQRYKGVVVGKVSHFTVVKAHRAVSTTNHASGAQCHRRVAR